MFDSRYTVTRAANVRVASLLFDRASDAITDPGSKEGSL